jgi:hypothetical protein
MVSWFRAHSMQKTISIFRSELFRPFLILRGAPRWNVLLAKELMGQLDLPTVCSNTSMC